MPWKRSIRRLWSLQRQAAVEIGLDENRLRRVDALIGDDVMILRSHTEWSEAFRSETQAIEHDLVAAVARDPSARQVVTAYLGQRNAAMTELTGRWQAEMQKSLPAFLVKYVRSANASPAFLKSLFEGVPRWQENVSEQLLVANRDKSVEARARALVDIITDVTEMTYKPLLWNLTRLTRLKLGLGPAKEKRRTLGEIRGELLRILPHPRSPIVAFIDDDAIFVRNGASHGRRGLPFDTKTGRITIEDDGRSESYDLEDLVCIMSFVFQRTRALWLVFYQVSGEAERDRIESTVPL